MIKAKALEREREENIQNARNHIHKIISDCGKMKDHINACIKGLGQDIINNNQHSAAVLHDLCNYLKHPDPMGQRPPQGIFKPVLGKIEVRIKFGAKLGSHAGIIHSPSPKGVSFWDIGDQGYACIVIDAEILDEQRELYKKLVPLVKETLEIWEKGLREKGINIPVYKELNPFEEAARFGQHASLFVESFEEAIKKASILTTENRFRDAIVLYNYALTKCENDSQRADCYACLGLSYEDCSEIFMAFSSYRTSLEYSPNKRGVHVNFGRICLMLGDKRAAMNAFEKEILLPNGDHETAQSCLCQLQAEFGEQTSLA